MATHSSILAWTIPMNRRAWWAAVYGVAQSWSRLKQLSSSKQHMGVPPWLSSKDPPAVQELQETRVQSLFGEFHGQRSLRGYSPWDFKESNMTE